MNTVILCSVVNRVGTMLSCLRVYPNSIPKVCGSGNVCRIVARCRKCHVSVVRAIG